MVGLFLNQYYSVSKTILSYAVAAFVLVLVTIGIGNELLVFFAMYMPIIFLVSPAFEVLKHESQSGWNKFVLTLPVNRGNIVQSQYLFFLFLMSIGVVITIMAFVVAEWVLGSAMNQELMYTMMTGVGIAFIMGAISYPATYVFGTEKSDTIVLVATLSGVGLFLLAQQGFARLIEQMNVETVASMNGSLVFNGSFLVIGLVLFVISYFVTMGIYNRKEY
ncbi:ABC-2 transporter permease [Geomicrobium sp. JCM 19055]|uniref:ABC-2 transporter permease n=1 Tax=Geomicrobium sp. JCM 19055 TaxID=1460649 RepID=UPI00045ED84F|nr:ABC-2 transporter permease [Geomicrobium sp. JCM 19055]GAJ97629.1 ABC transporter permease protein [Geomicrobium sp. JCM 19055]